MKRLGSVLCFIFVTWLVAGCASSEQKYGNQLEQYVGQSEADLYRHWGKPSSIQIEPGGKRLGYSRTFMGQVLVQPAIYQPYFDGKIVQHRIVQPERWATRSLTCDTIFKIEQGIVTSWEFHGDGCSAK